MTELVWDRATEHRYEAGVDRGVLYLPDGTAIPWNGLISVTDKSDTQINSHYLDGNVFLQSQVLDAFKGSLRAYTYPDAFDDLTGTVQTPSGVFVHEQRAKPFHLSYRTRVGNEVSPEAGYKIHVFYNLLAAATDSTHETVGESPTPVEFEWDLNSTPSRPSGYRPTSHVSIDSRRISPSVLADIEAALYGTSSSDPSLPSLIGLLAIT